MLESFVTKERDKAGALKFMKRAMKRFGNPEAITTDGLSSYKAAMTELGNADKQEIGRLANNRVENSHLPIRRRERAMLRFRQMKTLQKFASVHANVHKHFNSERQLVDRPTYLQGIPLGRTGQVAVAVRLKPLLKDITPPIGDLCELV